jgi:response regulator of citrate/malate metabolism
MDTKTTILIIDDEKDFCELVLNILRVDPYLVECAYNIQEALKILTIKSPDFIFLDNNLPDGKGIDFLKEHNSLFAKSKVIMITADASDNLRKTAFQWGVFQFLVKPFSLIKLRNLTSALPDAA